MQNMRNVDQEVVSIDPVVFSLIDEELNVLLLLRKEEPFKNTWMLPGGTIKKDLDYSLEDCANRVLLAKTGVVANYKEQLVSIGGSDIDPRGWTVSISYIALINEQTPIEGAKWVKLSELGDYYLGFKHHYDIIEQATKRLTDKVNYSTLPMYLMEDTFTLPQLQRVYEVLLNKNLHKSTFRQKMEETGLLQETGEMFKGGSYRHAKLYTINEQKIYNFRRNIV